ncbi:MAG: substrate-binding domain-containing protein, partial [Roseibium sp.]
GLIAGSLGLRDHADRYAGLKEVLSSEFPHLETLKVREGRDDNTRTRDIVGKLLEDHPDLSALYNIGAGNRGVIAALEKDDRGSQLTFIGHELTPYTREALISGTMDALIAQDPGHEIRSAIRVLKALCDGAPIVEGQERIGIDIFLKDNLPDLA